MSADLVVRSRSAQLPGGPAPAAVVVDGGRIVSVERYDADVPAASDVDLGELALLPGLVDTHVHVNEPGRTEWEGFATATRAAAAGGVTTVIDMPLNAIPPTVDVEALHTKRAAARGRVHVDVGFWGGAVPGNQSELAALHREGVFGFKCFTSPSGVEEFPPLPWSQLPAVMAELTRLDALLVVHAEDPDLLDEPADGGYAGFLASRPTGAEDSAIRRLAELAAAHGTRTHVLHLSAATALPIVAEARAGGAGISAETCPHYLTLAAEDVPAGRTEFKCCPPIRERANAELLWQALAGGTIDCVVSDHSPCVPSLKDGGFDTAWGGIASLQLGLPLVWTEARRRGHSLADVVRWMSAAPARLVGLHGRKGAIAQGQDADLVAFAPEERFTVDPAALAHRHPVTPYAGAELTGVVHRTWLRGRPVDGVEPGGTLLCREATDGAW